MKERNTRANATDINKSPREIRYVFIAKMGPGVSITTTYRTLKGLEHIMDELTVVDLRNNLVNDIELSMLPLLLDEWRDNYFDPDWYLPMQTIKFNKVVDK